jgi:transcriptional regulator with XRE-family HTH domain
MILLRKLRLERGLTYRQLEKETGVGELTIRNVENKHYNTSNDRLKKLADYFGIADPVELTKDDSELIKDKSCLNQRCLLNKQCYCQSEQVIAGASCENQNLVTDKTKKVIFDNVSLAFAEI